MSESSDIGAAPQSSGAGVDRRWLAAAVAAITLGGLLLRLSSFDDPLLDDELSTYFIASASGLGGAIDLVRSDLEVTPPLYFALAWLTEGLGDPAIGLRLWPMLAGLATIPLTALLGTWTVGRRAAIVAALIVALSPFLILESADARAHPVMLVLVLVSTLALVRAVGGGRTGWWVAYAAFSCAAIWTHYTCVFVLAGQFAWAFLLFPKARPALIAANVAVAIGYLPWLVTGFPEDQSSPGNLIEILHPFGIESAGTDLARWSIGQPYVPLDSVPGDIAVAIFLAGLAVAAVGVLLAVRAAGDRAGWRPSDGLLLVIVLALATPVGEVLYSIVIGSLLTPRNLIASWPGLALALGALVSAPAKPLRIAATALVVGAFAIGAVMMLDADNQRPDYDAAAEYIEASGDPDAPVIEQPYSSNPLSPLEVSLNDPGRSIHQRHPVYRVGTPTRRAQERARDEGLPPVARLPAPTTEELGRKAASRARGGELFVVTPEPPASLPIDYVGPILEAIPSRLEEIDRREFPGVRRVTVRVFRVRPR